jgi:cytochrome P450
MMTPLMQTLRLIVNPTNFLEDCAAKYGDCFTVQVLGINSPPVVFFENFQPEIFLNQKFSPFEYLPFGGGYRGCIGAAFSMFELKLIVATILSRFELKLAKHHPVRRVRRGITIVPGGGVPMIITHRKNNISGKIVINSCNK